MNNIGGIITSDNDNGNNKHYAAGAPDGKGGQFAPTDANGSSQQETQQENTPKKVSLGGLFKGKNISSSIEKMGQIIASQNVPRLSNADDILKYSEQIITKNFVKEVLEDYVEGSNKLNLGNRIYTNIWAGNLAMHRYKENHAEQITMQQLYELCPNYDALVKKNYGVEYNYHFYGEEEEDFIPIFRNLYGEKVADSYFNRNNKKIFGTSGCADYCVYTTIDKRYSERWGGNTQIFSALLDTRDAYFMSYDDLVQKCSEIKNNLRNNGFYDKIKPTFVQVCNGNEEKAVQMINDFKKSIEFNPSVIGVMLGLDYCVYNDHQRNLYNISRWKIVPTWRG